MNEERDITPQPDDDADLGRLLQAAGPRPQPDDAMTAEVRAAVAAEWRAAVTPKPAPRRNYVPWLAAASAAAIAVGVWYAVPRETTPVAFASVARTDGVVEVRHGDGQSWQALSTGGTVAVGDDVRVGSNARVALLRKDGLQVRLGEATLASLDDAGHMRLDRGLAYVDAGVPGTSAQEFMITTEFGDVRHLGTQYLVKLDNGLDVRVREGLVAVGRGGEPVVARAGERLSVDRAGQVVRSASNRRDDAWRWAESAAPGFAIEGRTLDEFLGWAARETGRTLVYASADAAREAEATRLKGSVEGLAPESALAAVMATTPALRPDYAGEQLRVERAQR